MTWEGEFDEAARAAAERALGLRVTRIDPDLTRLTAMITAGSPPDVVRAAGALDTPFLVARKLALDLDPYLAASSALSADDLEPIGDVWRFDGVKQGAGPRYGLTKDYSQDAMFWCDAEVFAAADVPLPDAAKPLGHEEWLDLARRLTVRRGGRTRIHGLDVSGQGMFVQLMGATAAEGGSVFSADLARVDFSAPEATAVLGWHLAYMDARVGFSPADPNPDGWPFPAFQARRMAMATAGYWFGALLDDDPALARAAHLMPAPLFGGPRVSPCYSGIGMWIPRACPDPDAAWAFFEWYFGGEPARERAVSGFGLPALKSLRSSLPQGEEFQRRAVAVQEAELPYLTVLSFTPYARSAELEDIVTRVLRKAHAEGLSAGKTADALNTDMNAVLARGRDLVG
ncbi:extracellular solute-binding protein [Actinocorallia sp. API 0066]|uniref:extracellular solute-binding protein n=1 Tax=Actinocorallia sp. API 0066 TaxID=2896846 RepID=UPI001E29A547|nr:extracellular solute-binding protein [Actinocorallia sp. API 0066]MCD0452679.1 extracellular solute-binding protein [Actinocorallia sp. API 0066]